MRDFTLKSYRLLLSAFQKAGYHFQTFEDFLKHPIEGKTIILRHDVDEKAWNALKMAQLEKDMGVNATYYFRVVQKSNVPEVVTQIATMGHEVGYHYEDLSTAEGDFEKAIVSFEKNLTYFRQYYPVKTVSMHGSSTSKYDNRLLWQRYKLSDFGLIGEPYISLDFDKVYYLTDTGYAWDGGKFATRDIVVNDFGLTFHSTQQVVECIDSSGFPEKAMILAHTLWTDNAVQWASLHLREFMRNNVKMLAKKNRFVAKLYHRAVNMYWKK